LELFACAFTITVNWKGLLVSHTAYSKEEFDSGCSPCLIICCVSCI